MGVAGSVPYKVMGLVLHLQFMLLAGEGNWGTWREFSVLLREFVTRQAEIYCRT